MRETSRQPGLYCVLRFYEQHQTRLVLFASHDRVDTVVVSQLTICHTLGGSGAYPPPSVCSKTGGLLANRKYTTYLDSSETHQMVMGSQKSDRQYTR